MKYIVLVLLISNSIWSQNIQEHKLINRVIIINADKNNIESAENQFNIFSNNKKALLERKMVMYKCLSKDCTFYNWKDQPKAVKTNKVIKGFKMILIGLDGGVKYKSKKVEKLDVILNLIDSMPMRQQEIKSITKND